MTEQQSNTNAKLLLEKNMRCNFSKEDISNAWHLLVLLSDPKMVGDGFHCFVETMVILGKMRDTMIKGDITLDAPWI